jgi:hypothetical protein
MFRCLSHKLFAAEIYCRDYEFYRAGWRVTGFRKNRGDVFGLDALEIWHG